MKDYVFKYDWANFMHITRLGDTLEVEELRLVKSGTDKNGIDTFDGYFTGKQKHIKGYISTEDGDFKGRTVKRVREWDNRGFPPVGTVCDFRHEKGTLEKVLITYQGDGLCCYKEDGGLKDFVVHRKDGKFFPIPSQKKKLVEAAYSALSVLSLDDDKTISTLEAIYDAGFLNTAGDK